MALLKVGSKAPVFVTHLEFIGSECQIFCQVGDVGGQADTLAERVAESVENGLASQISGCGVGDLCLALFHEDNSWYRGRVLQNLGHSLKVYFIDYGNTETVKMNDIRAAPDYVLAIPALSTKCIVSDCTPLSGTWTDEEKKKIETMLHSGEFTCEIIGTNSSDANNEVYIVKLYNTDAPNTPVFVRPASNSRQSLKPQNLPVGQEFEVYVSFVESGRKFWVQLKNQEDDLNSLMTDITACFAEDLPSTGDIVNPINGQVCAACFSDDGAFYRGIVKNVQGGSCTVFFVDYGNHEEKSTSELFTLPQALCQLPMQAVLCSYKFESPLIEDKLHKLAGDEGPSVLKVLSGSANTGYSVEINSVEQILNEGKGSAPAVQARKATKLWQSYTSVVMQTDGIYDVCLSHVDHPGQFYVQLLGNASNLDKLMQAVDEVAHNYDKLTNLYPGYACLAKFSDGSWYRGEVMSIGDGKTAVAAVDFGFIEVVQPSQLRNTDPNFKLQPAQAVKCTIDLNKLDQGQWKAVEIEKFKALAEKRALVANVSSKAGCIHQVKLYETENGVEEHISAEYLNESSSFPGKATLQSEGRTLPVAAAPVVNIPQPEVSLGSKYNLCFTAVKSLCIYGQLTSTPVEKVAKLQTDLNTFFEKKAGETLLKAEVGSACCTQYVDGGWYRGIVTSVSGGKAEVAFVDFGDSVMKSFNDLKVLPPRLSDLPQQCILCKIVNLSQDKFEKLVNKRVEVELKGKEDGVYPTYKTEITDRQINNQFQEASSSRPAVFKGASSRTFGRTQKEDTFVTAPRNMSLRKPSGESYSAQDVAIGSTQEVMVTYVKDPYNFQVVLEKMNSSLDVVMDQLHEYYDKLPPGSDQLENPRLGQPCIAQFTEDKGWYRAIITGLMADGQAEVMYVDYGNNEYTDKGSLKQIKPQFMSLEAQAVQCRLSGVSSQQGFWSPEHIVQFTEMVEEQSFQTTFKTQLREQGQVVYKVELVDKKGININEKFGTMTGTTCQENESGPSSRSVSASKLGQDMKVTVAGGNENTFGNKPRTFGRQPSGGNSGFGSKSEGWSKPSSTGDDGGWNESDGTSSRSFGSKKTFESSSSDRSGFGGGGSAFGRSSGFGSSGGTGFGSGGSGGGRDCYKCGESGHMARDCTNPPKGGGGGGRECYKCGESGHMARDCTNPPKGGGGGGGRDCYKCGESGHMARDCTNPPKGGGGGGRDCYKCGESGHMARDCTNPPKEGLGRGGGGRDCYKCGESGHMARDCTNPPKPGFGGGRDCYKCGESGHMARDCTNPPKEGAGPRKTFGGGSDRSSDGGFGNRGGGFGSRASNTSEDWGDGAKKTSSSGGFGFKSDGGFGGKPGDSGKAFGSRGGGGGFGTKSSEADWGSGDSSSKPAAGGFSRGGGFKDNATKLGHQSSPFAKKDIGGGGDDWETEATPVPSQVTSQAGDGSSTTKVVFSSLTLDTRETFDVYVVYVANPEQFWCQIMKNCPSLEQLMEEMNTFYNKLPNGELSLGHVEIGMPCAAKFSEDNMWYRAEVLTPSQSNVEVQFVDYGNTETVALDKLRHLKPEYLALKTQGIRCGLDDILATDKVWTKKAIEDFEDLTQDKHLVAKVINRTSDMTHILDLENLDEKVNIAETMCEKGHCKFRSVKSSPVKQQIVKNPYPVASIQLGEEIDIYVSWIENPEEFWIQPVSQENELLELVEKVQELYTTDAGTDLKIDSVVVGQAVVAKFTEDEAWYRGYVEKLVGDKCKVRFTDYGNCDMVEKDSLRYPTDELKKENTHAVLCKLARIRPLQVGQWNADARDIMDGLVKDEVVKCKVISVSNGQFSVELVSKGVDIRQEMIQAAVVRGEKEASPVVAVGSAKSTAILMYQSQIQLNIGTTESVIVSHTDSVASFWCQPVRTSGQLEDVMAQLETHCKSGTCIQDFPMGMACAAKFSEDEMWYRAKVTAAYPDSIEVLFVDYGNTEKVLKSDVCELTEDLVQLPPQAIECELMNSSKASNQLTAKFTELIGEQEVQAVVVDILDDSAVVHITLPSGKDVGEELGLSEPGSTTQASPVRQAEVTQSQKPEVLSYTQTLMPTEPVVVFVTQIISPSEFYIQRADKESQLNELMAEVSKYCQSEEAQTIASLEVGQVCCAKFSGDGSWYRAKIVKIDGKNCTVEFVDYGNVEATTVDDIRSIPEAFVKAPPFVLQCSLEGIIPVDVNWSDSSVKKFEELAVDKDLCCIVVKGSEVILKCGDTDISEALVESGLAKRAEGSTRLTTPTAAKCLSYNQVSLPTQPVDVYVSHVTSPGDFYVQLVDQEGELNQLMEKLDQKFQLSTNNLKIDTVFKGQAVCAKYSEDEAWYRAEILQTEGTEVNVQFIDYGNSEKTAVTNLRELNDDLVAMPPYAIMCSLNNVKPVEGVWTEESAVYFETQTSEKVLQCEFVSGNSVCLKLDDTDITDGLIDKGYAHKATEIVSPSKQKGQFTQQTVPVDSVSCFVSHVDESGAIYIQLLCEEDTLNTEVEKVQLQESGKQLNIESVMKGDLVCARFSEDQSWYRAVVTSVKDGSVTVRFVDYGNCDEVKQSSDLRVLPEDNLVTQPLAYACRLQGLKNLNCSQIELLQKLTADKEFTVTFITSSPEYEIQLEDENHQDIVHILAGTTVDQTEKAETAEDLVEEAKTAVDQIEEAKTAADQAEEDKTAVDQVEKVKIEEDQAEEAKIAVDQAEEDETAADQVEEAKTAVDQVEEAEIEDQAEEAKTAVAKVEEAETDQAEDAKTAEDQVEEVEIEEYQAEEAETAVDQIEEVKINDQAKEAETAVDQAKEAETAVDQAEEAETAVDQEEESKTEEDQLEEAVTEGADVEAQVEPPQEKEDVPVKSEVQCSSTDININSITDKICALESEKMAVGQRVKVVVSHSESPLKFWVQIESEKTKLDALLNTMYDFYNACTDEEFAVESVDRGMLVAALYPEDESWYRAEVVGCDNGDEVEVMLIDHGNTEVIARQSLRKLPTQFSQMPKQALECCLGGIQPRGEDWSEEVKEAFTELTADKELLLDVGSIDEQGVYKVQLLDMGMSVADLLLERDIGVLIATPVAVSTKVKQIFSPDTADDVIARLYAAKGSATLGEYGYKLRDLGEADPTISSHNVLVTSITSPVNFWCRLQDNSYDFYQDTLQENYNEESELLTDIEKGDKCVVFLDGKDYHRGTVLSKFDNTVDVKLVDIGNSVVVPESDVFKLKSQFDTYPQLAFCCSFTDIVPVDKDEFAEDAQKVFKDTVLELNDKTELPASAKATVIKEENGVILVELTVDRKDIADCLVEKGIAKFNESTDTSVLDSHSDTIDVLEDFGAFKNVQLDIDSDFDVILIDCFDINRLIFHSVDQLSLIDKIGELSVEAVTDREGGEGIENLKSGPCLAKCPLDNMWKRANLRSIYQTSEGENISEIYKVFFVDYGSSYDLPKASILLIPENLKEIPAQAIICHLDDIEPADGDWNDDCYNFLTEQCMNEDANLVAYVNSYHRGIHTVFLSSKNQGEKSVNHLLVELGIAAPVVGSQMEMSMLAETAETSFHEISMSRQDSYGESSDLGDTSYEPDSSYFAESSVLTEEDSSHISGSDTARDESYLTEDNTSCLTEGDISGFTEGDTSYLTEGDTSSLMKGLTEGDTSYLTEGDISGFTEGDTSYLMEGDTSCLMEGDTSCLTEGDTSCLTEGDTSCLMEGDTSCLTEGDTSYLTEGDESYLTVDSTSYLTEGNTSTSYLTDSDTSNVTEGESACVNDGNVTPFSKIDTSESSDRDTPKYAEGDTSEFTEGETTGDTSLSELDSAVWVCESCSGRNEIDQLMAECQHCHSVKKEETSVGRKQMVREEFVMIPENLEMTEGNVGSGDINEEIIESLEKVTRDINELKKGNRSSDIDPHCFDESDIDESYRQFDYSPTGYTTSELDTTDLKEVDESTDTAEFDPTELADYDTTGIEGGGEDLSMYEYKDMDTDISLKNDKHELDEEGCIKILKSAGELKGTTVKCFNEHSVVEENKLIEIHDTENNDNLSRKTELMLKEDKIPLFFPVSSSSAVVADVLQGSVRDQTFPSVSDTTYPNTSCSVSDFTFTSSYDTSYTDSMICEECKVEFSSLETTGCESEISFYICELCQQKKKIKSSDSDRINVDSLGEKVVVEYIAHDENEQKMIEVANEHDENEQKMIEVANAHDEDEQEMIEVANKQNEDEKKMIEVANEHDENDQKMVEVANEVFPKEELNAFNKEIKNIDKSGNKDVNENEVTNDIKDNAIEISDEDNTLKNATLRDTTALQTAESGMIDDIYGMNDDSSADETELKDVSIESPCQIPLSPSGTDVDAISDQNVASSSKEDEHVESTTDGQSFIGKFISLVVPSKIHKKEGKVMELNKGNVGDNGDSDNSLNDSSVDPEIFYESENENKSCNTPEVDAFEKEVDSHNSSVGCLEKQSNVCSEDTTETSEHLLYCESVLENEMERKPSRETKGLVSVTAVKSSENESLAVGGIVDVEDNCMDMEQRNRGINIPEHVKLLLDELCDKVVTQYDSPSNTLTEDQRRLAEEQVDVSESNDEISVCYKTEKEFQIEVETEGNSGDLNTIHEEVLKKSKIDLLKENKPDLLETGNISLKVEESSLEQENEKLIRHLSREKSENLAQSDIEKVKEIGEIYSPDNQETEKIVMSEARENFEVNKTAEVCKELDVGDITDTHFISPLLHTDEHEMKSTDKCPVISNKVDREMHVTDVLEKGTEVSVGGNLTDQLENADSPTGGADSKNMMDGNIADDSKIEENKEYEESEKDEFEDALDVNRLNTDKTEDLTSIEKGSADTGDNESFYDADEDEKE